MLGRSGKTLRLFALAGALTLVAACGSTGTRPAAPLAETRVDAPAPAVAPIEVPQQAATLHAEALAAMSAGDWLDAELALERLVAEFPAYPGPYVNLAIVYRQAERDDEALTALGQALAIAPNHPAANNELGVLRREQGEFDAAEAAYRRALEGNPDHALAHYNLGVLLDLYLRREAEALEHYEAYQALVDDPDVEVGRWVVDLRRRLGMPAETARVAREGGP